MFDIIVVVRVAEAGESHYHQFDEEKNEYCHEANTLYPGISGDGPCEALICQGFVGGSQQLQSVSFVACDNDKPQMLTCMKAVATITPDPKYFAMKKAHEGIPTPWCLTA